jgi:hypothetical protein
LLSGKLLNSVTSKFYLLCIIQVVHMWVITFLKHHICDVFTVVHHEM